MPNRFGRGLGISCDAFIFRLLLSIVQKEIQKIRLKEIIQN